MSTFLAYIIVARCEKELLNGGFLLLSAIGAHLDLRIMGRVEAYYLVVDIGLILEIVLLGLNPCVAAHVILW